MGSLSNLYISQSYQSLIHFSTDTSASATLTELEDGVGQGLGIYFNTEGDFRAGGRYYVGSGITISGSVLINTHYSASTEAYYNSYNSISNTIRVQGSYPAAGYDPPSINDVQVGWLVNGENVTNAIVTAITGQGTGDVLITINQNFARPAYYYTFTGNIETIVSITGSTEQLGNFDLTGSATISNDLFVGGHLIIEDGVELTGSIDITGDVTASNAWIQGDLVVSGTINAYEIITTIESSSIIFSSGSNILGDSTSDTQTLNGLVRMSGSSQLTGSMGITGDLNVGGAGTFGGTGSFIGNLTATGNISSSTLSGVGNVTLYSQSVDSRLDYLEGPFSTSVDLRLDQLENWSSSLETNFATQAELTQTASVLQNNINTKLNTSSFNDFQTNNYNQYTSSTNSRLNVIETTYATTGSNQFRGNQTITGSLTISSSAANNFNVIGNSTLSGSLLVSGASSLNGNLNITGAMGITGNMIYSGSVRGNVITLTATLNTASMDCSLGNFFTITLASGSVYRIQPINIQPGETIALRVTQPTASYGSLVFPTASVDYPTGYQYTATPQANAVDILTFLSFDTASLYYSRANQFI